MERIIEIASEEGDIILDPFCGSGTTLIAGKLNNRKVIGIDISEDAVNLTNFRLRNPIKSESNLVKKGKQSYKNVDILVEKFLHGVEYIPVQRNYGIDAILKETYHNTPILIRIQKENETLEDALNQLNKAAKTKNSKKSFLIRTNDIKSLIKINLIDSGIEIIDSTSYKFREVLDRLKN